MACNIVSVFLLLQRVLLQNFVQASRVVWFHLLFFWVRVGELLSMLPRYFQVTTYPVSDTPQILQGYVSTTYHRTGPYWVLKLSFRYVSAAVSAHQLSSVPAPPESPVLIPNLPLSSVSAMCAYKSVVSSLPHSRSWIDLLRSKLAVFLTSPSCSVPRFTTWWPQIWDVGSSSATGSPLYEGGSNHVCCIGGIRRFWLASSGRKFATLIWEEQCNKFWYYLLIL
jgi:hypothetical protein